MIVCGQNIVQIILTFEKFDLLYYFSVNFNILTKLK